MKHLKLILMLTLTLNLACEQTKQNSYSKILAKFEEWKSNQYQLGNYEVEKNCNPEYVLKETYSGSGIGIPPDSQFFYTDLNEDEIIDALICFNPSSCGGGNALMNAQERVLIISNGSEYVIDDKLINNIEEGLPSGWLYILGANGEIMGEFQDYKEGDARCCPSIVKQFQISYKDKKLEYVEQ